MVNPKTKIELYNTIVDLVKSTGQGLPGIIADRSMIYEEFLDELIEDGLIKKVITKFKTLPDDTTYCLTSGYVVEEDNFDNSNFSHFSFIRHYLGIENDIMPGIDISVGEMLDESESAWIKWKNNEHLSNMKSREDFNKTCSMFIEKYYSWLMRNKHELNIMRKLEHQVEEERVLSSDEKEWIKSRSWYKTTGEKLINDIEQGGIKLLDNKTRIIEKYNEILELDPNYDCVSELEAAKKDLEITKKENKLRKYIINKLNTGLTLNEIIK